MTVRKALTYTGDNLVKKIALLGADTHTSEFFYDSARQRYKRIDTDASGNVTTTLYLGSVEKTYQADGSVDWKRRIGGVAQVTHQVVGGQADAGVRQYFHKGHLGSIVAISSVNGTITQRMAFDPWGARRSIGDGAGNPDQWQASAMDQSSILTSYGTRQAGHHPRLYRA